LADRQTIFFSRLGLSPRNVSTASENSMRRLHSARTRAHERGAVYVEIWHYIVMFLKMVQEMQQYSIPFSIYSTWKLRIDLFMYSPHIRHACRHTLTTVCEEYSCICSMGFYDLWKELLSSAEINDGACSCRFLYIWDNMPLNNKMTGE
jgi:hypothetical protein